MILDLEVGGGYACFYQWRGQTGEYRQRSNNVPIQNFWIRGKSTGRSRADYFMSFVGKTIIFIRMYISHQIYENLTLKL